VLLVSFLLVIVATIFLLSGLFLTKDLALIFISIACSAVAGIVLVLAVMKSRPRPGAVPATVSSLPDLHGATAPLHGVTAPLHGSGPLGLGAGADPAAQGHADGHLLDLPHLF